MVQVLHLVLNKSAEPPHVPSLSRMSTFAQDGDGIPTHVDGERSSARLRFDTHCNCA